MARLRPLIVISWPGLILVRKERTRSLPGLVAGIEYLSPWPPVWRCRQRSVFLVETENAQYAITAAWVVIFFPSLHEKNTVIFKAAYIQAPFVKI